MSDTSPPVPASLPEDAIVPSPLPVSDSERAPLLDLLRGFALFGILSINIIIFALPGPSLGLGDSAMTPDRITIFLITWLVQAKFYSLFSFLFGVGFAVQMRNADRGDIQSTSRFIRRSLALAGFGLAHIILLWEGDILFAYALIGMLLPVFRTVSDKWLKRWIVELVVIPFLLVLSVVMLIVLIRLIPAVDAKLVAKEMELVADMAKEESRHLELTRNDSYGQALIHRLMHYTMYLIALTTAAPTILAMFLSGLLIGRRGVHREPALHKPLLRRTMIVGMPLGMLMAGIVATMFAFSPPLTAILTMFFNNTFAGPCLGLGYAALIALVYSRTGLMTWMKPIASAGRMALTNYLTQSLICTILFAGYAAGWVGQFGALRLFGIACAIYACQLVISPIWLSFFQFGPMEWLWRAITYKTFPPFRKLSARMESLPAEPGP